MKKSAIKPFGTEAELCKAFIESIGDEWVAYAETCDWDILLVRKADGFQIGIQAKLKLNAHVISQTLEHYAFYVERAAPDCRAVLVPEGSCGYIHAMAPYIGVTVIRCYGPGKYAKFHPSLPKMGSGYSEESWHEWCPMKRHKLPEYIPDVPAGVPCPIKLTTWKIAAMKIAITLEKRGFVTRADFKHIRIDHRRWLAPNSWMRPNGSGGYIAGKIPDFRKEHPVVYEQIAAEADKWMLILPLI